MNTHTACRRALAMTLVLLALTGCASHTVTKPDSDDLYQALGAQAGIERIVANFIVRVGEDRRLRPFFEESDLDRFFEKFSEQLCEISGGPCRYTGDSMQRSHAGMNISEADFNRTVEVLIEAMNEAGVPYRTQNRLLARLAPMQGDIVKPVEP